MHGMKLAVSSPGALKSAQRPCPSQLLLALWNEASAARVSEAFPIAHRKGTAKGDRPHSEDRTACSYLCSFTNGAGSIGEQHRIMRGTRPARGGIQGVGAIVAWKEGRPECTGRGRRQSALHRD